MKKLLLTAALGLGLGGGAWKYQNPEGTLDELQAQASASVDRLKRAVQTVQLPDPTTSSLNAQTQETTQQPGLPDATQALSSRLDKLEQIVLSANDNQASSETAVAGALASPTQELAPGVASTQSPDSLESTLSSLQASIQTLEDSKSADTARTDTIDSRLELLMRRIEEQTFAADIASVMEGLQVLSTDVLELQSTLEQQATTFTSDLSSVNERISALNSRLDTLGSASQQGASTETTPSNGLGNAALASLSTDFDERFVALEERLQTLDTDSNRLTDLNEQMLSLQADIASLKQQYTDTDRSLAEISTNIRGLQQTASEPMSIETMQAEIREQLATAQLQLENNRAAENSTELETLIETTRNRIQTLEQRVQELPASSVEADNALQSQNALEAQISALENRLESLNRTDPELANTLSTVQQQVEQLTAKSFVTLEDLKARNEGQAVEYKIYFDSNSAAISSSAATALQSFIAQEKNRTTGISIYGFTDRSGSANYNQKLAEQRATNVRSYLIQNGMDYTKIKALSGLGEDAAAAILPDDAEDSEQRVVILYAELP